MLRRRCGMTGFRSYPRLHQGFFISTQTGFSYGVNVMTNKYNVSEKLFALEAFSKKTRQIYIKSLSCPVKNIKPQNTAAN